jgi:hypothetical protein
VLTDRSGNAADIEVVRLADGSLSEGAAPRTPDAPASTDAFAAW